MCSFTVNSTTDTSRRALSALRKQSMESRVSYTPMVKPVLSPRAPWRRTGAAESNTTLRITLGNRIYPYHCDLLRFSLPPVTSLADVCRSQPKFNLREHPRDKAALRFDPC